MHAIAFQAELRACIRATSPVLVGLLESEGCSLADVVPNIEPANGWPRRLRPLKNGAPGTAAHYLRHLAAGHRPAPPRSENHGVTLVGDNGGIIRVEVIGHSLEVFAEIGGVRFRSRHGTLTITIPWDLPATLVLGCVGRTVEEVIDHPALRGQGWTIKEATDTGLAFAGCVLTVETGSVAFRIT